jgi:hypothetical protein
VNVRKEPEGLEKMLAITKGKRKVPVIVEEDSVVIGFEGKA